ncbi:MAG: sporulation integral membrane protein YtvI [Acidobacteria bacterium]|jgi:sporulation integral membrane protein YtvI|nr:sporulation integral membrane protein YtvI [Acidobacteriota bacterium]
MGLNELEKKLPLLTKGFYILAALALVLLVFKVAFTYLLPFVFAFLMASAMEPFVRFLVKRRLPRSAAVAVAMVVYFGLAFALCFFAITRLVIEVSDFSKNIPDYGRVFTSLFNDLVEWGKKMYLQLPKEAVGPIQDSLQSLAGQLSRFLASLAGSVIAIFTALPEMLMFAMFTVVATFFASKDRPRFKEFLSRRLAPPTYDRLALLKSSLVHSLAGFLKAQLMLMTLTFTQCFIGLSLIGIRYAFIISLVTAVVDILPVLGTGTVLVPWGVVCLIMGKTTTGIGLLVLYLVIMVVRYIVEPKIIGTQLGLHPLIALAAMFVGLKVFGVLGLILGPAIVVVLLAIVRSGLLPGFREG